MGDRHNIMKIDDLDLAESRSRGTADQRPFER